MNQTFDVDLNADIGEGMPYDKALIKLISSCNIACGGHAGSDESILKTINLAKTNQVKIGAHPSYPDNKNFGRQSLNISIENLVKSIDSQLNNFKRHIQYTDTKWHHIKFHGALYNNLKTDTIKAKALVNLIKEKYRNISLYVPPNSVIKSIAEGQIPIFVEGFADRAYNEDLSLVSRQKPNAVLFDEKEVVEQILNMIIHQRVKAISGQWVSIQVDTICLHGDNPKALDLAKTIVESLQNKNIKIQ